MHMSSTQLWLGINSLIGFGAPSSQQPLNILQEFTWSGKGTIRTSEPAMDSFGYLYYTAWTSGDQRFSIIKTESDGTIVWQKLTDIYGTPLTTGYMITEYCPGRVRIMSDDSIWVAMSVYLIKISSAGVILFQVQYLSLVGTYSGLIYDFYLDSSNNMHLVCFNSDNSNTNSVYLVKVNSSGTLQWATSIDANFADGSRTLKFLSAPSLVIDSTNNVYLQAVITFFDPGFGGDYDTSTIFKYNSSGVLQWQHAYWQNNGFSWPRYASLGIDSSDNLYLKGGGGAGIVDSTNSVTKITAAGAVAWARTLAWPPTNYTTGVSNHCTDLLTDSAGNSYTLVGPYYSSTATLDASTIMTYNLVKYNSSGALQYQRFINIPGYFGSANYERPYFEWGSGKTSFVCRFPIGNGTNVSNTLTLKLPIDGSIAGSFTVNGIGITMGTATLTDSAYTRTAAQSTYAWHTTSRTASFSSYTPAIALSSAGFTSVTTIIGTSVSPSTETVQEGGVVTFTVTSNQVLSGTLYYNLNSTLSTATSADFTSYSGSFTMTAGTGSFSVTLTTDAVYVEAEYFYMNVLSGSTTGTVVATSIRITIEERSAIFDYWPTTMAEGGTLFAYVQLPNIADGTTIYYNLSSSSSAGFADFSTYSGSFVLTNHTGLVTMVMSNDAVLEGEYFAVDIMTGSTSGTIIGTSRLISIIDSLSTQNLSAIIVSQPLYLNDDGTFVNIPFVVNTTGFGDGSTLYYSLSSTSRATIDRFSTTYPPEGSFTITGDTGTFTIEGTNSATGSLNNYLFSIDIKRSDGSILWVSQPMGIIQQRTGAIYNASITAAVLGTVAGEAKSNFSSSNSLIVTTTGVTNGTTYYATINQANSTNDTYPALTFPLGQSFTINSNAGSLQYSYGSSLSPDNKLNPLQAVRVDIRSGSTTGTVLATTNYTLIYDNTGYSITPSTATFGRNTTTTYTVTATGMPNGTRLYWFIASSTMNNPYSGYTGDAVASDFSGATSGYITINNNSGTFDVTSSSTASNAHTATLYIQSYNDNKTKQIWAASSSITFSVVAVDFSYPSGLTVTEGQSIKWTISTTGIANGTYYWRIESSTFTSADLTIPTAMSGSFTLTGGGPVAFTGSALKVDSLLDAGETFYITIRSTSTSGTILGTSATFTTAEQANSLSWRTTKWQNTGTILSVGDCATNGVYSIVGHVSSNFGQIYVMNLSTLTPTAVTLPAAITSDNNTSRIWYEQGKWTILGQPMLIGGGRHAVWQCPGTSDPTVSSNWTVTNLPTSFSPGGASYPAGKIIKGFINNTYVVLLSQYATTNAGANEYLAYSSDGVNWTRSTTATPKATADNYSGQYIAASATGLFYHSKNLANKVYYLNSTTFTSTSAFTQASTSIAVGAGISGAWTKEVGFVISQLSFSALSSSTVPQFTPATNIPVTDGSKLVVATKPGSTETTRVLIASNGNGTGTVTWNYSSNGGANWTPSTPPMLGATSTTWAVDCMSSFGNSTIVVYDSYWGYFWVGTIA